VILEPIQGESGVLPAEQAYLEGVRALCNKYNALLIFDEVQSGMGRSGKLFAHEHYGVTPDVLTTAKSLGGGFPISAMLTTSDYAAHLAVGTHGTTFGGNPLACAVGEAVLDIINTPAVLDGVLAKGEYLRAKLRALGEKYNLFELVRGKGLLVGAVLNQAYKGKAGALMAAAERADLLVLVAGPDVIRFAPSLVIEQADLDEGLARFERAVTEFVSQTPA
jgi:acetylornithine/N-succinyldiaminopimelate aminotransferase